MKNTAEFAKRQGRKAPKSVLQHYCISSLRLSRCKHSDYYGLFDQRTTEAPVLQGVAPQQHSNEKIHRGEVQSEYADPHLGDADTDDEQEAVAENGYGILRPDADYRSEVQPTIQQED